jgi:MATE family multidrug resistance protein
MAFTRYEEGSMKELWHISFPLMVSFLSTFLMTFTDRLYLSLFSQEALSAAVSAGSMSWAPVFFFAGLAAISEVFVAQNNGANRLKEIPRYVWQMIWLGIASIFVYLPLAWFFTPCVFGPSEVLEQTYYRYMLHFGPIVTIMYALSSFYIGRGRAGTITLLTVAGNLINLILDPLFIFGYKDWIPSMGIKGAAIATGIGYTFQCLILFYLFLRKGNRNIYQTHHWHFDWNKFKSCLRIGLPSSVCITIELLGWGLCYWLIAKTSGFNLLVVGVCQSILFPFLSYGLGLEKGAAAIAGNLIGANKRYLVHKVIQSGVLLCALFAIVIWVAFIGFPDYLIQWFIHTPGAMEHVTTQTFDITSLLPVLKLGLVFLGVHLTLENFRWLFSGILIGAGDTYYLLFAGVISVWTSLVLPLYICINILQLPVNYAYYSWVLFSCVSLLTVSLRYYLGSWKRKTLINA